MQTRFSAERLREPGLTGIDSILRRCVHCGFCTATCPTYQLLGDELDGPRGRIYLIKNMLEDDTEPSPASVRHVDRCLSCLACMSTCPAGVNYMHLVDYARAWIERRHRRPLPQRMLRGLLRFVLTRPALLHVLLACARPLAPILRRLPGPMQPLAAVAAVPRRSRGGRAGIAAPAIRGRVAFHAGCVQQVLGADVNAATVRVLERIGYEVLVLPGNCCGAVEHHLGAAAAARARVTANVDAWTRVAAARPFTALISNASGCGTMLKDYGYLLRGGEAAGQMARCTRDVMEFLAGVELDGRAPEPLRVAYQPACSLQHGQRVTLAPVRLLERLGYELVPVTESHLCCGAAGTYNILQPALAAGLGRRKAGHIAAAGAMAVAVGNLACMLQMDRYVSLPVLHPVQLVDWALGGPRPARLDECRPRP